MKEVSKMTETVRKATTLDLSDIAVLLDTASHGLLNHLWRQQAGPELSALEFGRERIRTRSDLPSYIENWQVFVSEAHVCGGYAGYAVPNPYDPGDVSDLPDFYEPLLDLEAQAAGTWHMIALAVFPAFRGLGIGKKLLKHAERTAVLRGCATSSIIAKSSNHVACALYEECGYECVAERPAVEMSDSCKKNQWTLYQRLLRTC